jgi:hypothetical protein
MTTESLTYSELSERLGSSPEAARSLARRLRLVRKPGNDGKVRVIVDLAEVRYTPAPGRSPDGPQVNIDGCSRIRSANFLEHLVRSSLKGITKRLRDFMTSPRPR